VPSVEACGEYIRAAAWLSTLLGITGDRAASCSFLERTRQVIDAFGRHEESWHYFESGCANYHHILEEAPWTCMLENRASWRSFRDAGDYRCGCVASTYYGKALLDLGDPAEAEAVLRETLALAER
jgi:hypothetical protein